MNFKTEPCRIVREYSSDKPMKKPRKSLLAALLIASTAAITGCGGYHEVMPPLAGKPAIPGIHKKSDLNEIVLSQFKSKLDVTMRKDYKITLTNGANIIEFVADAYCEKNKIAYEWTANGEYPFITNTAETLDKNEIDMIKKYKFGSTYILIFDSKQEYNIMKTFDEFAEFYTNETKTGGK
ncbi:MAG: hypothetical protein A2Y33_15210 [Spirochaetes bacterium GWF1_51_8]|nr:MAG: hypothetical protein A2Y33_15210 [Spirochaetes bacterium GWF1_51_8]